MAFNIINIRRDKPADSKKVIVYWLGGAGFAFKFGTGQIVCIDPYLSDSVEQMVGFRRLSLAPVKANELFFDLLLASHDHPDHMDTDSFDTLIKTNPGCKVIAGASCRKFLEKTTADYQIVSPGDVCKHGKLTITTVPADHGEFCPDAVGFVIDFSGRKLYFTGDTAYNESLLQEVVKLKPEIILPCINGAFGNLTENEAARLTQKCQAKVAIPCHFGLFAEHGGDPGKFREDLKAKSPETKLVLLTPGRGEEV